MTNSLSGGHSEKEKEHKERIRKLKAKTSKMRLAVSTFKKPKKVHTSEPRDITLGGKKYTMSEFEDHMASTDRPTYSGEIPGAADKLRKQRAKTKKAMKRNKSDFTKILQDDHPYKRKKDHPDDMNTRENRAYNTNQLAIKHQKETPLSRREKQNIADAENRERGQRAQPVRERHS